ncbi:MAG: hypothetical protein ACOVN1_08365 [Limnohabitans sp.]
MTSWKKMFALGVLGVALNSVAQVNLRPEVAKALQAAQEAIQAQKPDEALNKIQDARALSGLAEPEKMLMERLAVVAAINAQKFDLAAKSLSYLLQSKELSPADRLTLSETMVSVSQRNRDHAAAVTWARRHKEFGGNSARVDLMLLQSLSIQGLHQEVVQEMNNRQKSDAALGRTLDEATLRIYAISLKQLKDDTGFVKVLTELTKRFPSKDYWSDLLNTLGRLPSFNQRYQLDVSRLMAAVEVLEDADDYTDMAVFAMKSGLPAEALRVLDKGHAAGVFAKGTAATNYAKLKQQALARAAEDDKAMQGITVASNDATQLVQLADVLLSKGQASAAVEAYQKALSKGGLRREAEVRLHLGIALLQSQQKEAAKAQLNAVAGDEALVTLAGLWASLAR